jgi:8-oxo-dGTP pyrophosphatase MutT (NUDIX family)
MNTEIYKKQLKHSLRPRTLCFIVKENEILLGFKKKGFGQGKILGIGGKVEENETIEEAAIREVKEEVHVIVSNLEKVAVVNYYFPEILDESWNMEGHVFIPKEWSGNPEETEEIRPEWFHKDAIPFEKMWDDASFWLPRILEGESIKAEFFFDKNLQVIEKEIKSS